MGLAEREQPAGGGKRQGPQQDVVDHAEHRGGRARPEGEGQDGDGGIAWPPTQLPKDEKKILDHVYVTIPVTSGLEAYTQASNSAAAPCPPPTHIVTTP